MPGGGLLHTVPKTPVHPPPVVWGTSNLPKWALFDRKKTHNGSEVGVCPNHAITKAGGWFVQSPGTTPNPPLRCEKADQWEERRDNFQFFCTVSNPIMVRVRFIGTGTTENQIDPGTSRRDSDRQTGKEAACVPCSTDEREERGQGGHWPRRDLG